MAPLSAPIVQAALACSSIFCHYPAAKHTKGICARFFDWDTNKYHGEIPEAAETYNVIGNINEYSGDDR